MTKEDVFQSWREQLTQEAQALAQENINNGEALEDKCYLQVTKNDWQAQERYMMFGCIVFQNEDALNGKLEKFTRSDLFFTRYPNVLNPEYIKNELFFIEH